MPSPEGKNKKGIYRPTQPGHTPSDTEQRIAEFSYQSDALADLIVKAWTTPFGNQLTTGNLTTRAAAAKQALDDRGIHMKDPVVITEAEYYGGYTMSDPDGVVFVLPNGTRADTTAGHSLLEVAKLLMACTPNGI